MNLLQTVIITGCSITGSLLTVLYIFQEKLLYHPTIPTREYERKPDDYNMQYVDVEMVAEDGVKLHGWLITQPQSTSAATFLYFHGNAGNIGHRLPDVRHAYASGFNILMVSYRGYGQSEGQPSEKGFRLDAVAALSFARDRTDVLDVSRLYVFGRSIGGACALALAALPEAQHALRGVVVENTFTSIDDMIDRVLPALRFAKPLNRNKWNSQALIKDITLPILFISGLKDELCPPEHMQILYSSAQAARFKVLFTVSDGEHNDTWWRGGRRYRQAIKDFVTRAEAESGELNDTNVSDKTISTTQERNEDGTCTAPSFDPVLAHAGAATGDSKT